MPRESSRKHRIAAEMCRVLRPGGLILWYDFWINPLNPQTRGVRPVEIRAMFPGCEYRFKRITLASPIARATASAYGMPTMRNVYVPQPVVGRTPDELRAYIEGVDPVSKRPFMQEVVEALTKPLSEEDFKGLTYERAFPRLLPPDTPDNLRALFIENRWTDMLPIVLPTDERVPMFTPLHDGRAQQGLDLVAGEVRAHDEVLHARERALLAGVLDRHPKGIVPN